MKKISLLILAVVISLVAFPQQRPLDAKEYQLPNGLKVVLCKDSEKPEIHGAVCINVGSINDPVDATGMAHYFEHIMFKGTDKIGTLNWEEEKIYLDSISYYYDKLHETQDKKIREGIQLQINRLSIIAAQYAIPNETDVILGKMGGVGVNAYTSYENTVYHNSFPSNQLYKWLEVYAERFRNPVFRLFQSELETVYEENNMYQDNPMMLFFAAVFKETFGEHPYGRPIIGYAKHLKNPQTSKMQEFFNTYYVPNNMTLLLVGDLDFDATIEMIEKTFGNMSARAIPDFPTYHLPVFKGATIVEKRQTPINMGILGFNTVPVAHQDNLALEVVTQILSNEAGTGLADELMLNHKIMMAAPAPIALKQHGVFGFWYMPKILKQSHKDAEKQLFNCLDSLKTGNFSDALFESVKMKYLTDQITAIEGSENIFETLLDYVEKDKSWSAYQSDLEKIEALTKEDIIKVANKYFTDDYLIFRSKMGIAKKDKVNKPNWKPIEIKNTDTQSEFAKMIEAIPVAPIKPQSVNFKEDITIYEKNPAYPIYSVKNPYNDIFSLKIYYQYGSYYNKDLENAIGYLELQGTQEMSFKDFNIQLQLLGASITMYTENDLSYIEVLGFNKDFEEIMTLCRQKFFNTDNDENKLKVLIDGHKGNLRMDKSNASICAHATLQYALFGKDSKYLRTPTVKGMGKYTGEELISCVRAVFDYAGFVTFSGNLESELIYNTLLKNNFIREDGYKTYPLTNRLIPIENSFHKDELYYLHNKKFLQSNIHIYVPGIQMQGKDKNKALSKCFNQYFGNDMYSIGFQEIREFRSLGYAVFSRYLYDYLDRKPSYLYAFLGTQSDKTIEGIDAMRGLITDMPEKTEKYQTAKEALLAIYQSWHLGFREIPYQVYKWKREGYMEDPTEDMIKTIESVTFDDVVNFYKNTIQNKPVIISLSGNIKKVSQKDLSKFGVLRQVKMKEIFCE